MPVEPVGGVCAVQSGVGNAPASRNKLSPTVHARFPRCWQGPQAVGSRADLRVVRDDSGRCCGAAARRRRPGRRRRSPPGDGPARAAAVERTGACRRVRVAYAVVRRGEGPARPPDPRDQPGLRQTEPAAVVVPRFGFRVQSEPSPRAPTPWNRSVRRPAASAGGRSPSARRVTVVMRTARRRAARSAAAGRCGPRTRAISAVPKAASTIATGSARTAPAAAA